MCPVMVRAGEGGAIVKGRALDPNMPLWCLWMALVAATCSVTLYLTDEDPIRHIQRVVMNGAQDNRWTFQALLGDRDLVLSSALSFSCDLPVHRKEGGESNARV